MYYITKKNALLFFIRIIIREIQIIFIEKKQNMLYNIIGFGRARKTC